MTAAEEARADAAELRKVFGEKESRVESLENELAGLKKVKAESDKGRALFYEMGVTRVLSGILTLPFSFSPFPSQKEVLRKSD